MLSAEKKLNLPLPEMTFGNNALTLTYTPATTNPPLNTSTNSPTHHSGANQSEIDGTERASQAVTISFNAIEALGAVPVGEGWEEEVGGGVRVSMADKWGKQRYVQLDLITLRIAWIAFVLSSRARSVSRLSSAVREQGHELQRELRARWSRHLCVMQRDAPCSCNEASKLIRQGRAVVTH